MAFSRAMNVLSVAGLVSTACVAVSACGITKQQAKSAIDVATAVCVIANAAYPDDYVMAVCKIEEALAPAVKELLSKQRAEIAQARARAASSCLANDAGAPVWFDGGTQFRFADAGAK